MVLLFSFPQTILENANMNRNKNDTTLIFGSLFIQSILIMESSCHEDWMHFKKGEYKQMFTIDDINSYHVYPQNWWLIKHYISKIKLTNSNEKNIN